MPLLDHFHAPLYPRRHWESFYASWTAAIGDALNRRLPDDHYAETQVHPGPNVEIDVATFYDGEELVGGKDTGGGVVTLPKSRRKAIAPADFVLPALFPAEFVVNVFDNSAGTTVVAAIELVSSANKDRPENRKIFAAKCAAYLQRAIGLIVVDVVTNRQSRPLDDLIEFFDPERAKPEGGSLQAVSYRPAKIDGADSLEVRIGELAVASKLPTLPLFLNAGRMIEVDFEATYEEARSRSRL